MSVRRGSDIGQSLRPEAERVGHMMSGFVGSGGPLADQRVTRPRARQERAWFATQIARGPAMG